MAELMLMSKLYAPTLKEDSGQADIASHQLLLRAGMIRRLASGVYNYLPLGFKILKKIEDIVREEMVAIGSQEILMPVVQPAEIWLESGRWDDYGPELMRLKDRHENDFVLGPTHEEVITTLVRHELRSYRELPVSLFQIQTKFRDEIRPRFGLLRGREFVMKDAYSFHTNPESLDEHYQEMKQAYGNICDRLGLDYRVVQADSGQIGGSETVEFMALADSGEAEILFCDCGYAAEAEAAQGDVIVTPHTEQELQKVHTPNCNTISHVAEFFGVDESETVKAMVGVGKDNELVVLFIPGDHELNEIKVNDFVPGFRMATAEEIEGAGLKKGFIGPVGLPDNIKVAADISLKNQPGWVSGGNDVDYHYIGAVQGRDFTIDTYVDLVMNQEGDLCPSCGKPLQSARGIEVSQVFKLGTKYSESLHATYADTDGEEQFFHMGSYGVGVSRSLAAVVEQSHDEHGIIWPQSIAPYDVHVIPLAVGDEIVYPVAEDIAEQLIKQGISVLLDDRKDRAGVKFADADLIGIPLQIIVGKRGIDSGELEIKARATGEKELVHPEKVVSHIVSLIKGA